MHVWYTFQLAFMTYYKLVTYDVTNNNSNNWDLDFLFVGSIIIKWKLELRKYVTYFCLNRLLQHNGIFIDFYVNLIDKGRRVAMITKIGSRRKIWQCYLQSISCSKDYPGTTIHTISQTVHFHLYSILTRKVDYF